MGFDRDFELAVRAWVAEGSEQLPDPALDAALREIARTPQRRSRWLGTFGSVTLSRWPVAAATVSILIVAVGLTLMPGSLGVPAGPAPTSSATPTSTLTPIAATPTPTAPLPTPTSGSPRITAISGHFEAAFGTVEIVATGEGSNVAGSMTVSMSAKRHFSASLRCSRTNEDGLILIGGPVTDSTHPEVAVRQRVALAILPGDPTLAILWFEGPPRGSTCEVFLGRAPDDFSPWLQPVEGDIALGTADGAAR